MKAKVTTGKGFRGLVNYQTKPGAIFIASSTGLEPADFLRQCAMLRSSRPDVGKPVLHFSLSQPPGEPLTDEQWQDATDQFVSELGLEEHDFFCVRHTDTEHDHIHICVSKIHPNGGLWDDGHSALKAMTACEKIEQNMGLTKTRTLSEFRAETGSRRNRLKDKELKMMARTGTVGDRRKAAITAKIAAERARNNGTQNGVAGQHENASQKGSDQRGKSPESLCGSKNGASPASHGNQGAARPLGYVTSRKTRDGEAVIFKIDSQIVAKQTAEKIELFTLDPAALDFAIKQAVKSGQVPLELFGTPEFIAAARERADIMKVPVAPPQVTTKGDPMQKEEIRPKTLAERLEWIKNNEGKLDEIASRSTTQTRLAVLVETVSHERERWRKADLVLRWVKYEKVNGMPPAEVIALARAHGQIDQTLIDNAARVENVPLPKAADEPDEYQTEEQDEQDENHNQHHMKG